MPKSPPPPDEFPAQTFDTFYSLRTADDEPELPVVIEQFPVFIPDPPTAAKSAHHKPQEG